MYLENLFLRPGQTLDAFILEAEANFGISMQPCGVDCLGKLLAIDFRRQVGVFNESRVHLTLDLTELRQIGGLDPKITYYMTTKLLVGDNAFLVTAHWRLIQGRNSLGGVYAPPFLRAGYWHDVKVEAWFEDLKVIPNLVDTISLDLRQ